LQIKIINWIVMILLIISFNFNSVKAEDNLKITGPDTVFEGEIVEFLVTLNDNPIQARVSFGNSDMVNKTDSTTGLVRFTMPSVPIGDQIFLVSASIPGGLNDSYYILVKNDTQTLEIELLNNIVDETKEFNVTITSNGMPLEGVNVFFNSSLFYTNAEGVVKLTAPDVLVTTNYGLSVTKSGFIENSTVIKIIDKNIGIKLMELINPFIIEAGKEYLEILIINKNGGLENVTIYAYYEGIKYGEYTTSEDGYATIETPLINTENYFSLDVYKEGYKRYYDDEIIINFFAKDLEYNLVLSTDPSELFEGELVTTFVTDEFGNPIQNCDIWRGTNKIPSQTDYNGFLYFNAPSVFLDREYYVYAIKKGYNFAEDTFTVRNIENDDKELLIDFDDFVLGSEIFNVTLNDKNSNFIEGAYVTFNSIQKVSNEAGLVQFLAPNITNSTIFPIVANKYNYLPVSASIEIISQDEVNGKPSKKIFIYTFPSVMENEEFTVTARNQENELISGVLIKFQDIIKYTDFTGTVKFNAPDLSWDNTYEILASKAGYDSAKSEIIIKNYEDFQFIYMIVIVGIIIFIGIIYHLRFRKNF